MKLPRQHARRLDEKPKPGRQAAAPRFARGSEAAGESLTNASSPRPPDTLFDNLE